MDYMSALHVLPASTENTDVCSCASIEIRLFAVVHKLFVQSTAEDPIQKINRAMQQALLLRCAMIKQCFALRKLGAVLDQAQPNLQGRTTVLRLSSTLHTGYCWYLCQHSAARSGL